MDSYRMKKTLIQLFLGIYVSAVLDVYSQSNTQIQMTASNGIYTQDQADASKKLYANACASCHGRDLRGTEGGVALVGDRFIANWKDKSVKELFLYIQTFMPKTQPKSLDDKSCAALIAFMLEANGFPVGTSPLNGKDVKLAKIKIGTSPASRVSMSFRPKVQDQKPKTFEGEWKQHRGDLGSANYSNLEQINASNAKDLKIAWRWKTDNFGSTPEFYYKATPLMVKGVLYTTAGMSRTVAAIDGETGETLWIYRFDDGERKAFVPRQNSGRGLAYWTAPDGQKDRIFFISPGFQLVCLDPKTGQPITDFGDLGVVDLKKGLGEHVNHLTSPVGSTSPPIIVNDVIVMGAAFPVGLAPASKKEVRGDIMGYDVKTGKRKWIFHTVPQKGEYGNETWLSDSWTYTGNAGAWAPLTADEKLGYVYLPLEAATGDFYGGHRPGDNLFSQSLVCLNAKTGERVWHYQLVHHDIWDYDLPAPPILVDIKVDGKSIKAIVQVTKQAFAFVFDRITGKPVWPIEEKTVPKSSIPGEITSPTQPSPTKPAPFDVQGYSEDILVDFTPAIRKEAIKIVSKYEKGPIFTPVSIYNPPNALGTLMIPDAVGGANWQGAVYDPEKSMLYVSSSTVLRPMSMEANKSGTSDMAYVAFMGNARIGPHGLPLVKPPYGRITAIDLNSGNHKWMIPNADTPDWIKNNPALKGINIPRTGLPDRVGMLVTKTLLFAGEGAGLYGSDGGGGKKFRAYDKETGKIISELTLPANQSGLPMTYSINGKQYIVVAVGAVGHPGELVALSL